jgi:y4mF family transcriptional regulator
MTTEELGRLLRAERRAQGLTQEKLAMAAGTGTRFVGDLERGKPTCRVGETLRVIATLGLELELRPRGSKRDGSR